MRGYEGNTIGSSRIQAVLGIAIFLVGALSFGPLMISAWEEREAEAQRQAEAEAAPKSSMTWVVDPEHPGKVKLAVEPRKPETDAAADATNQ